MLDILRRIVQDINATRDLERGAQPDRGRSQGRDSYRCLLGVYDRCIPVANMC
jgi:hypothetical protein